MKRYFLLIIMMVFVALPSYAERDRENYDLDDDGLIEINDLEDLNEIRNRADGQSLYGGSWGCYPPSRPRCSGFELTRDLDFDTNQNGEFDEGDSFWNGGEGWEPISLFMTTFEGNGFAIRNLTINRPVAEEQSLFSDVVYASVVNLALIDVSINAMSGSGALVGTSNGGNFGGIFVTGKISGSSMSYNLGGIIGISMHTGLGNVFSGVNVTAGYFSGSVIGYAGQNTHLDSVLVVSEINLAIGAKAGLVGSGYGRYINSYMATDVAGLPYDNTTAQIGSFGALLSQLKCPVGANDTNCIPEKILYKDWADQNIFNSIYWDFGSNQQLPGLILNEKLYRFDYLSQ